MFGSHSCSKAAFVQLCSDDVHSVAFRLAARGFSTLGKIQPQWNLSGVTLEQ